MINTEILILLNEFPFILQAEVNLNGIGKWKGRHVTCTVRLVGGQYDSLLEWPCDLSVNIVLKDQPANRKQVGILSITTILKSPNTSAVSWRRNGYLAVGT